MEKITIRVLDFTEAPGPRFISQGEHSGEQFYVDVLNKKMAQCIKEDKELDDYGLNDQDYILYIRKYPAGLYQYKDNFII